jgi:rfaE bifunctional protein kinase chain/domain
MNLLQILERASKLRIAVVGDLIIDRYIDGTCDRISPEAPVMVLRQTGTRENRGGAGNVTENLRGLGVQVSEFYGKHVPIKTRVMSGNHHVIRIDEEQEPYMMHYDEFDIGLDYGIHRNIFDCVVISDYGKGAINSKITSTLIKKCNDTNIPVVVDTKHNLNIMDGATLVKCNLKEWNSQDIPFPEEYHFGWMNEHNVSTLVVTKGSEGISYWTGREGISEVSSSVKGLEIHICDPCGAGDTVTAVLAMIQGLEKGRRIHQAVELANIAASEVCRHPGVQPINKELLIKRYNEVYGSKI